jgi:hypothetical protein
MYNSPFSRLYMRITTLVLPISVRSGCNYLLVRHSSWYYMSLFRQTTKVRYALTYVFL